MSKFKISSETQGSSNIPIPPPRELDKPTLLFPYGYEFPIVNLSEVKFDPEKEITKDGITNTVPVLIFKYIDNKKRAYQQIEFPIENDDEEKEEKFIGWFNSRVKHIFEETIGADKFKEIEGKDWADYFKNIADAFNNQVVVKGEGDNAKKVVLYKQQPVYLKLTYNKSYLQLPTFPNFIQKATVGATQLACELRINPTYDKVKPQESAKNNLPNLGGHNNEFGGSFAGGLDDDFPLVPSS